MRLEFIEATDIADSWFQALTRIFESGREYVIDRGSYAGQKRLEFDYVTIHVKFPAVRPLLPKIPTYLGIPDPASEEYLEQYITYLMTSIKQPNEDYTYGQFLEPQIQAVIDMFKKDGYNTNQAYMTVGNEDSIFLNDPPCLRGIDCRISEGKLHFMVYFRSNDLWGGYPVNIASIQILKEYIADEVGVEDGELVYASKGLHLYDHMWDIAKTRLGRK